MKFIDIIKDWKEAKQSEKIEKASISFDALTQKLLQSNATLLTNNTTNVLLH